MTTNRDTIADRIGNTLRGIGRWCALIPICMGLGWCIRGDIPLFTASMDVDLVLIVAAALVVWMVFDTADYLITGRKH